MFGLGVCQRVPTYETVLETFKPMSNVHLAYTSVYQRMSDILHTLAYASTIRYSVIPPLVIHGGCIALYRGEAVSCTTLLCNLCNLLPIALRAYSHQRRAFFSVADISKSHTFKWDPLADEVLEAA